MDDGRVDGRGGGARDIYCVLCVPYAPLAYIPITLVRCTCARYADANRVPLVKSPSQASRGIRPHLLSVSQLVMNAFTDFDEISTHNKIILLKILNPG